MKKAIKVIGIIISIIAIIVLVQFAYAKYISIINGRAEAQIAQFKFIVTGQSYSAENGIIFATTRNDRNSKVAQNMLAPGTYGEIPINIDATGTQTFLEYTINISLENKPENLKFYYDKERTLEIDVNQIDHYNSEFSRKGFLSFADNDLSRTEYIYWEWPMKTGETEEDINKNDVEDSKWMNTIMTMSIGVKGTQVAEKPMYYAANYGDIVNYTTNNKTIRGVVVNKIADVVEIMPVDENGKAVCVGNLRLGYNEETTDNGQRMKEAIESYNKAIKKINDEAIEKYKETKAIRALRVEDVNRLMNYNPTSLTQYNVYISGVMFDNTASGIKRFIVDELTEVTTTNNEIMKATELEGINVGDTIAIENTYGDKTILKIKIKCKEGKSTNTFYTYSDEARYPLGKYFTNSYCFLASRSLGLTHTHCAFNVRICNASSMDYALLYSSDSSKYGYWGSVVPVISLLSNIHAEQITDANNTDRVIWEVKE